MDEITAIVLAAGGGTRMAPIKSEKSKVMLWILGKPVLEYVLSNIKEAQVKKVIIVVLEKTADQIIKYFGKNWNGLDIDYVYTKETLGPSYVLNEIKDHINTPYFLTQYADSITKENLIKKVLNVFESNKKVDGVLALREADDLTRYGIVKYKNDQIVAVVDKPGTDNSPSNDAVIGTFILNTELFKKAIDGEKFILHEQLFPAEYMLKKGAKMKGYFFDGQRVDVGKPEDLFNASMLLSNVPTKCIVFDADNTLYNTHQISNLADKKALTILAKEVNIDADELYRQWRSIVNYVKNSKTPQKRTRKYSYGVILEKYKKQGLTRNMYQVFEKTLIQKLKPIGEIREILSNLPQEKILVTEDERELVLMKLKAAKLLDFFDQIITSTETKTMKPAESFYKPIFKKYEPGEVLFVGDDYKKDLEIPSKMGSKILFVENENSLLKLRKKIHFMGAAGAGAAAVAGIAKAFGYDVTACDINPDSAYTKNLKIKILTGHSPSHLKNIDLVITSPAVEKLDFKNPELLEAKRLNTPTVSWQQFQGDYLQKDKFVITVAGAYGKSTTTSMIAKILIDAGLDPTCEIGARVLEWQNNFRIGESKYYICESDEYNNNFLNYHPDIAVILNVDWDHPDFFKTKKSVLDSYKKFIANIKPGGILIIPDNLLELNNIRDDIKICKVGDFGPYNLSIIGDFRKDNANAALTIAQSLKLDLKKAKEAVESFIGAGRRLEYKGEIHNVKFYDDYAVQPYTVKTTANALKNEFKNKKLTLVFEPHTFSRIKTFSGDFIESLKNCGADEILITEVYPAREKGNKETLARELAKEVGLKANYTGTILQTADYIKSNIADFEVILSMGAGDSYKLFDLLNK